MNNEIKALYENARLINASESLVSGVHNLDQVLTINGSSQLPILRYSGIDANLTNWTPWNYGETLTLQAGTAPTLDQDTTWTGRGTKNQSVLFNGGGYYKDSGTSLGNLGTDDFVIELIYKSNSGTTAGIASKYSAAGWYIQDRNSGFKFYFDDNGNSLQLQSGAIANSTWYHVMIFVNRDENSNNGARIYFNTVDMLNGNPSSVGDIDNTEELVLGAERPNGFRTYDSNIVYLSIWKQAAWHQAGAAGPAEWTSITATRYALLNAA